MKNFGQFFFYFTNQLFHSKISTSRLHIALNLCPMYYSVSCFSQFSNFCFNDFFDTVFLLFCGL